MLNLSKLRSVIPGIVVVGSYPPIIQSILDFEYLLGKQKPSIYAAIGGKRRFERYFWGKDELMLPYYSHILEIPKSDLKNINLFLNVTSGRRTSDSTNITFDNQPRLLGGVIFAEDTPEIHSLKLYQKALSMNKFIIGPASVGILIPGHLKLGAIGGVEPKQIAHSTILSEGSTAVLSASGGMTNELINILKQFKKGISFALSFGGERFPILRPSDALLAAQEDSTTKQIIYFGEIGGNDEYEMAELIAQEKVKKEVLAYIAGSVSEAFSQSPQFGHAKAFVKYKKESADEKANALRGVGVKVASSFQEFVSLLKGLPSMDKKKNYGIVDLEKRKKALFVSTISQELEGEVKVLGENLTTLSKKHSFPYLVCALLLGKRAVSKDLEKFTDGVFKLLLDHGPLVSGTINTIVAARADKDLVSSLAAGLLTVGKRFGGAINGAAGNWIDGVEKGKSARDFVEEFASQGLYIEGIGHRKYTVNNPDARVTEILTFSKNLKQKKFLKFAKEVEKITTGKKANLILNVDGAIAAVLLDILSEKEKLTISDLRELIKIEFFNAFFVVPRSVGFIAHYLDQKRLDEGLFRLPKEEVAYIER